MADEDLHLVMNCRSGEGLYVPGTDREAAARKLDEDADERAARAQRQMLAAQQADADQQAAIAELREMAKGNPALAVLARAMGVQLG